MKLKKAIGIFIVAALSACILAGCAGSGGTDTSSASSSAAGGNSSASFDSSSQIGVISREDGSGTRGAFIELFGVETKDADGNKTDNTTSSAVITNNTSVMMTTVAGDPYSIGYISLGSLDSSVKALKIDGVEATVANIKSGSYKIARPFNIATKGDVSPAAQDFINYILSSDGQRVISDNGYITISDNASAYSASVTSGSIVIAGSSSVTPVMEKLKEAYNAVNPNVSIEVQQSDSTTGMTSAIDGICDIGMASRELKDSETSSGLTSTTIAMDGIAVIVNNSNPAADLTSEQVRSIFTGETTSWSGIAG